MPLQSILKRKRLECSKTWTFAWRQQRTILIIKCLMQLKMNLLNFFPKDLNEKSLIRERDLLCPPTSVSSKETCLHPLLVARWSPMFPAWHKDFTAWLCELWQQISRRAQRSQQTTLISSPPCTSYWGCTEVNLMPPSFSQPLMVPTF